MTKPSIERRRRPKEEDLRFFLSLSLSSSFLFSGTVLYIREEPGGQDEETLWSAREAIPVPINSPFCPDARCAKRIYSRATIVDAD